MGLLPLYKGKSSSTGWGYLGEGEGGGGVGLFWDLHVGHVNHCLSPLVTGTHNKKGEEENASGSCRFAFL